jgi:hypothetical protein
LWLAIGDTVAHDFLQEADIGVYAAYGVANIMQEESAIGRVVALVNVVGTHVKNGFDYSALSLILAIVARS